jgi:hypothetical protein
VTPEVGARLPLVEELLQRGRVRELEFVGANEVIRSDLKRPPQPFF